MDTIYPTRWCSACTEIHSEICYSAAFHSRHVHGRRAAMSLSYKMATCTANTRKETQDWLCPSRFGITAEGRKLSKILYLSSVVMGNPTLLTKRKTELRHAISPVTIYAVENATSE